jgi:enamine deaminase RidA (YjgF/YER057c/UK114 family)
MTRVISLPQQCEAEIPSLRRAAIRGVEPAFRSPRCATAVAAVATSLVGGTGKPSASVRRFHGPAADEFFVLSRPGHGVADPARQAEMVYEAMLDALASEGVGPEAIVTETAFFRRIREHFDVVRSARSRVLGGARLRTYRPATTFIGQPPLWEHAHLELAAVAVVPVPGAPSSAYDVLQPTACPCAACSPGVRARVVHLGDQTSLYAGNIYGSGRGGFEEAYDMFRVAEGLLAGAAMRFGDVIRTWIHVRDIDRDYGALNKARREFFRQRGITRRPASTGVQGTPFPDAHDFSMSLYAVKGPRPVDVTPMSTPSLNEAWSYGADFSRGLRIGGMHKVSLYVSGTASVDEAGRTAHVGDFEAQAQRMLHNVASLLARQGATFDDLVSGVTYLKNRRDARLLRSMFRTYGFGGFPCALVEAPLCRAELLCETEVVAMLPRAAEGA